MYRWVRGKIRLIEGRAKCRHLKKYEYLYGILIHTGKGGGGRVEPERRREGQQFTKMGQKYQHD